MKNQRVLRLLIAVVVVFFFGTVFNLTVSTSRFNESYPAVACPPNLSGLSTAISLDSSKTAVRKTGSRSLAFKSVGIRRYSVASEAAIVDANAVTPIVWQVRTGTWAGAVACGAPISTQWFVGGTGGITSKGSLNLVNSGLGKALVDVTIFDENGAQTPQLISVSANSYSSIPLSTLTPGSKSIAVKVVPRSGRINGFLLDERGKGLRALGGDIVNSVPEPTRDLVIPGIPQEKGKKKQATPHTLRLLVPGAVDARISAEIRSTDGTFAPVDVDGITVKHQKVVSIPLDINMNAGKFALVIKSDQPLLGSVYTNTRALGKSDFIWSTSAAPMRPFTMAVTGLSPALIFTGTKIDVKMDLVSGLGKSRTVRITGSDIATFQVPNNTRSVSFRRISEKTYGAGFITAKSGFGYFPLVSGTQLTKSSIPASNIRVLNP